jgi:hypothetical protein
MCEASEKVVGGKDMADFYPMVFIDNESLRSNNDPIREVGVYRGMLSQKMKKHLQLNYSTKKANYNDLNVSSPNPALIHRSTLKPPTPQYAQESKLHIESDQGPVQRILNPSTLQRTTHIVSNGAAVS